MSGIWRSPVPMVAVVGLLIATAPADGQSEDPSSSRDARVEVMERMPGGGLRECSFVDPDARPITGGCVVEAKARTVFKIMTPFGRVPLATCAFRFTAHVATNGTVALDDVGVSGANPCPDVRACREDTDPERQPWLGELAHDGNGYKLVLDACMDTCAGWFDGKLSLPLERDSGALRVRAAHTQMGESGLELTGELDLRGTDLQLTPVEEP